VAAPILVRLADTLIGAAIAHLFNYVWPLFEFAEAPRIASRLLAQLAAFADVALKPDGAEHDYRLARRNLIEAIAALSDSAGRMSIEPMHARKGLEEMAALLIAAHGLVAQLSAARHAVRTGAASPDPAIREWLQARLASEPDADDLDAPRDPLAAAALGFTAAARNYRRVAESEQR
jgi:uncharacterized membrane protein YccC